MILLSNTRQKNHGVLMAGLQRLDLNVSCCSIDNKVVITVAVVILILENEK
jgi:hypothetical protein